MLLLSPPELQTGSRNQSPNNTLRERELVGFCPNKLEDHLEEGDTFSSSEVCWMTSCLEE